MGILAQMCAGLIEGRQMVTPRAQIRIEFAFDEAGGLWAASSPDMPGLYVLDSSKERVIDRLPEVATALAQARGLDVRYAWDEPEHPVPGFRPIPRELIAA